MPNPGSGREPLLCVGPLHLPLLIIISRARPLAEAFQASSLKNQVSYPLIAPPMTSPYNHNPNCPSSPCQHGLIYTSGGSLLLYQRSGQNPDPRGLASILNLLENQAETSNPTRSQARILNLRGPQTTSEAMHVPSQIFRPKLEQQAPAGPEATQAIKSSAPNTVRESLPNQRP